LKDRISLCRDPDGAAVAATGINFLGHACLL
jgi:hypothetical protein